MAFPTNPDISDLNLPWMQEIEAIGEYLTFIADPVVVLGRQPTTRAHRLILSPALVALLPTRTARSVQVNIPFPLTAQTTVSNPAAAAIARKVNVFRTPQQRLAMLGVNTIKHHGTVLTRPGPLTRLALARIAARR